MYRMHTACRACGYGKNLLPYGTKSGQNTEKLISVANFGPRPLANDIRREQEARAGYAPLEVLFCPSCQLAQLSVVVDPRILYKDYPYVTSNTNTMTRHFERLLEEFTEEFGGKPHSVLEIGSNDGRFLKYCTIKGIELVHGVEPDRALALTANTNGVPTTAAFFPDEYECEQKYDVIVARHVFAHIDNWKKFVERASQLMDPYSLLWIEAPSVQALLDQCQADTIYHEHLSYVNLKAIECLLADTDLVLVNVKHYDLHGGCYGLVIGKRSKRYQYTVPNENLNVPRWERFLSKTTTLIYELESVVKEFKRQGKTVCGYGASAKSSFWVQSCGWSRKDMPFICDDTKQKWFRFSPGTDIPIYDEGALMRELPNYAVCFAWNFMPEILKRQDFYVKKGGKFIVPLPDVMIVP